MRSLLFNRMAFAVFISLCSSYSFANEEINAPFQLQNVYQSKESSVKRCLVSRGDEGEVAMAACNNQPDAGGLYVLVKGADDYYTIRPVNNSEQCLRTFAGEQTVKMDHCAENRNTAANYSSMRYWKLIKIDGVYNLENKYKSDIGSIYSCFSVPVSGDNVGVGECVISGGSVEYNNMRLWRLIN